MTKKKVASKSTRKKTLDDVSEYLKYNLPFISLIDNQTYKNNKTHLVFYCLKHGRFSTSFNQITRGSHCPDCGKERHKVKISERIKPIESILNEILEVHNGHITIVNPDDYKNSHTKLKFSCSFNHPIWETSVYHVIQGKGCPKCAGKNITIHEYTDAVDKIHQGKIELLPNQSYKSRRHKLWFQCNDPNHPPFAASGNNVIFRRSGCPECKKQKISEAQSYSTEQVYSLIKEKHGSKLVPIKGQKYSSQNERWIFRCSQYPKHNEFVTTIDTVLNKKNYTGCRECLGLKIIDTAEDLKRELFNEFNDRIVLTKNNPETFNSQSDKVEVYCTVHKITHKEKISNILKSLGCPQCSKESRSDKKRLDEETLRNKIFDVHRNDIELVDFSEYINIDSKVSFKCNRGKRHKLFKSTPHMILRGNGCNICKASKGEREIRYWLDDHGIEYHHQYRVKKPNEKGYFIYDFFLPILQLLIEFDGRQHFIAVEKWGGDKGLKKVQLNDKLKDQLAEQIGCKMLRIPYTEQNFIDKILTKEIL